MTATGQTIDIRPTRREDLGSVLEVLNAFSLQKYGEVEFTEKGVLAEWDSGDIDVQRDTRVAVDSAEKVIAFIEFWDNLIGDEGSPETFLYQIPGRVDPEIAHELIQFAEARSIEALAKTGPSAAGELGTYIWLDDEEKRNLFEKTGFREAWYSSRMFRDLAETPTTPQFPDGIEVKSLRLGVDDRAVFDARTEAWSDMRGGVPLSFEQWSYYLIETDEHFDPSLWFVAWAGEEVAGFCLCKGSTTEDAEMAWVTSLGVRRAFRRQGLATALLLNAFGEFYRRGIRKVGLDVDSESRTGANRIYDRAGMRPVRQTVRYVKNLRSKD